MISVVYFSCGFETDSDTVHRVENTILDAIVPASIHTKAQAQIETKSCFDTKFSTALFRIFTLSSSTTKNIKYIFKTTTKST